MIPCDFLAAALGYARQGLLVFPVHSVKDGRCDCSDPECTSPGKHPWPRDGLKSATADEAIITPWAQLWPAANVGIATGAGSGVCVVDIDDSQ